uniref:Uncharacterized protein n=1 Tax=Amphilophus citrinellus TaxID=61819 RepID=A0A3Q0R819_AMPCI
MLDWCEADCGRRCSSLHPGMTCKCMYANLVVGGCKLHRGQVANIEAQGGDLCRKHSTFDQSWDDHSCYF